MAFEELRISAFDTPLQHPAEPTEEPKKIGIIEGAAEDIVAVVRGLEAAVKGSITGPTTALHVPQRGEALPQGKGVDPLKSVDRLQDSVIAHTTP